MAIAMALSGCMTVFNAQEAQMAVAAKGDGCVFTSGKVDLADYSLRELVDFAMTNRPSVKSTALAVADARLALREIAADAPLVSYSPWTSPHLSLSGGYNASSESADRLRWHTEGKASAGISLDILIYDFGRNHARAAEQIEKVIAAEYAFIKEGYAVFDEVSSAYFNLLEADAMLEVALTNEMEYVIHLQQTKDRLAAGEKQRLDLIRARLDVSKAREVTVSASNAVTTCGASLMKALGIEASRGTRDEVFPKRNVSLSTVIRGFADTNYGITEALDFSRTNSPAMAIARARLRSASRAVDYAIADLLPSISAEIGVNWVDPLWSWHWGVSAVQSIFQGFRKTTAVDRAVVQMQSAAVAVDQEEQELSLALELAIAERDNAIKARETARASVASSRENLEMIKAQYREGELSRVEFTDSVSDYATALGSRISAFYRGQMAEAKLFALSGTIPEYREETVKERQ